MKAFYLWRHRPHQSNGKEPKKWTKVQQEAKTLLPTTYLSTKDVNQTFHDTVLSKMKKRHFQNCQERPADC